MYSVHEIGIYTREHFNKPYSHVFYDIESYRTYIIQNLPKSYPYDLQWKAIYRHIRETESFVVLNTIGYALFNKTLL